MIGAELDALADLGGLGGLGVGTALMAFVFRTLWRQEGGWRSVLNASREDAAEARKEASEARKEASLARTDAAGAREDARIARRAETECQRRLARLDIAVAELVERSTSNSHRLDAVETEIPPSPSSGE